MKTIEEKAKAYDSIIEKANKMHSENCEACKACIEELIPELAESEDKRIRKALISILKSDFEKDTTIFNISVGEIIDWLERQGESYTKKDVDNAYLEGMAFAKDELDKQNEQKPIAKMSVSDELYEHIRNTCACIDDAISCNNIKDIRDFLAQARTDSSIALDMVRILKPKFKVGDWVVYYRNDSSREVLQVYDIRDGRYYFTDNVHFSWSVKECDEKSHLWTIQDAKDGDVLAEHETIVLFKEIEGLNIRCYCTYHYLGYNPTLHVDTLQNKNPYRPATKKQRDLLFQKMNEAGYEWDAEKKELKKIDARENLTLDGDLMKADCMIVEQKPTWSEEDNVMMYKLLAVVELYYDRDGDDLDKQSCIDWLKSLKDRYTWKPSDEQMADLWNMLCECRPADHQLLQDIYYGLKKLKEDKL